jgi:hypothetical protein
VIGSHDLLFRKPARGLRDFGMLVIDEAFWSGIVRKSQIPLELLPPHVVPAPSTGPSRQDDR